MAQTKRSDENAVFKMGIEMEMYKGQNHVPYYGKREREEEADLGAKELSFLYSLFSLSFLSNSSESTDLFRHTFIYIFIYISPRVLLSCIHWFKFYLC